MMFGMKVWNYPGTSPSRLVAPVFGSGVSRGQRERQGSLKENPTKKASHQHPHKRSGQSPH